MHLGKVCREYVCSQCGVKLEEWEVGVEGREAVLKATCRNGHELTARWPIGSAPPATLPIKTDYVIG